MNILFVLENYFPHIGGVEVVFKNLAEGLAKLGNDVTIITHQLKNTKRFETINKVKVYRIPSFNSRYWFTFLSIPLVLKLAKKADIVHTTTYNGAFPARFVAKILKKPSIITVHEILGKNWERFGGMTWLAAKLHEFLEGVILKLNFDQIVCVSKSTEKSVLERNISKEKIAVIYNGIDYKFFDEKKWDGKKIRNALGLKDEFVYMFYGRPGISKGLEYLLGAVPAISKNIPSAKLVAIVSKDKAYRRRYEMMLSLIEKLDIKEKMILLDPVPFDEIPKYIKAADCVVVPSLSEGFGFTAAESCAMGKPVVASDTTSLPEVVSGKYVLVKPGSAKDIAKGVISVYKGDIRTKPKKAFRWDTSIKKYLSLYKKLSK